MIFWNGPSSWIWPGTNKHKPTLLLRDGLLRSMSMKDATIDALADSFEQAYEKHGTLLVGVAKRAKVLNYYSMSLNLENAFNRHYPCYCELKKDMEEEAYHRASAWVGHRSFGDLYFAKLTENKEGIILPIEIPRWLRDQEKGNFRICSMDKQVILPNNWISVSSH